MKKYSMLCGGLIIIAFNIYGLVVASIGQPTTYAIIVTAVFTISLVLYTQIFKERILLQTRQRQSYLLLGLIVMSMVYYTITALSLIVYTSDIQLRKTSQENSLQYLIVGINNKPIQEVVKINCAYYFGNCLPFMYYSRCFFVMFWRQNIVFIYRYLKKNIDKCHHTLLAHLPKIKVTKDIQETICSLCLQNYGPQEDVTRLMCTHIFHISCIRLWIQRSNCCPLCRNKVVYY